MEETGLREKEPENGEAVGGGTPAAKEVPDTGVSGENERALREENARLRAEVKRARASAALREALLAGGALPQTVGILAGSVDADSVELDASGGLLRAEEVIAPLRQRYGGILFRRTEEIPAPPLSPPPPPGGALLTREDLRAMTPGEINARWDDVRGALGRLGEAGRR
ncbi:MAG: hypothetical protein IJK28_11590 [Clostridia bacterium]|nr:hypothetical protein [Clostridia bacterium]